MDWDFVNLHGTSRSKKEQVFKFFRCYPNPENIFFFTSVADPDPGSGAFLTPASGIWNRFIPDPGSRIPDLGSRISDPVSRIPDPGSRISNSYF